MVRVGDAERSIGSWGASTSAKAGEATLRPTTYGYRHLPSVAAMCRVTRECECFLYNSHCLKVANDNCTLLMNEQTLNRFCEMDEFLFSFVSIYSFALSKLHIIRDVTARRCPMGLCSMTPQQAPVDFRFPAPCDSPPKSTRWAGSKTVL